MEKERRLAEEKAKAERRKKADEERKEEERKEKEKAEERGKEFDRRYNELKESKSMEGEDTRSIERLGEEFIKKEGLIERAFKYYEDRIQEYKKWVKDHIKDLKTAETDTDFDDIRSEHEAELSKARQKYETWKKVKAGVEYRVKDIYGSKTKESYTQEQIDKQTAHYAKKIKELENKEEDLKKEIEMKIKKEILYQQKEIDKYKKELDKFEEKDRKLKEVKEPLWVLDPYLFQMFLQTSIRYDTPEYKKLESLTKKARGRGLSGGLNPTRYNEEDDSDDEGGSEYDDGRDGTGSGGSIYSGLLSKVKSLVINPVEAVVNKVSDIGHKVIHGRMDYPPSAKAIIDKYADQQVQGVSLHRLVLPSIYTKILSVWTKGETERRLKEEPKDKLFHISMWVTLPNAVILCEKNEVIHLQVNPKRAKEEEEQPAPTPSNTTFRELLEKGRARVGDEKFFSYSAKSNNCGNWIEDILRANGIETQATRNFIGQDAHKILHGFPALRKTLNTLTDIAGRANVILEGGKLPDYPDWENMKWGSFTKQFERYNEEHPDNEIEDLEHFAKSILANPKEYQPRTLKRARFYLNVILKKKSHSNNIMPSHRMNGGAVSIPLSNAVMRPAVWTGAGYENGNLIGADPRVRSPMPLHAHHPNAVDTIFHDPNHPSAGAGIHHHHHYHIDGMGFFDWLDPNKNGVAQALDPNRNGLADAFKAGGSAENFGKQVASTLIHKGLPVVGQVAGNALGDLLMPETGGLGGMALGQAGKAGGNALGDLIGKETGYGLKKPKRFVKGSKEAKEFMASIRKKRSKRIYGGNIPEPPSRSPITNPSLLK